MKNCPFCAEEIQEAAIVCKHCGRNLAEVSRAGTSAWIALLRIAAVVVVLGVIAWAVLGQESVRRELAVALSAPVTLAESIENVPAASWRTVELTLPYSGNLDVSLEVVNGNPLDVFLTTPEYVDAMNKGQWDQVRVVSDFSAKKSKAFRRTSAVIQGRYYLVLRDTSLGILSSRASDVSVTARLKP